MSGVVSMDLVKGVSVEFGLCQDHFSISLN